MTASISIRVATGTNAATVSTAATGIDFISADNATYSTANRQAYPITAGSYSYEKWLIAYVDAPPDNSVDTFTWWGSGSTPTSTSLYIGTTVTGVTPVATDSAVATLDFTTFTASAKMSWHSTSLTATAETTQYAVWQLDIDADCSPGNFAAQTLSYSYEET